jgi:hypothetical protein
MASNSDKNKEPAGGESESKSSDIQVPYKCRHLNQPDFKLMAKAFINLYKEVGTGAVTNK